MPEIYRNIIEGCRKDANPALSLYSRLDNFNFIELIRSEDEILDEITEILSKPSSSSPEILDMQNNLSKLIMILKFFRNVKQQQSNSYIDSFKNSLLGKSSNSSEIIEQGRKKTDVGDEEIHNIQRMLGLSPVNAVRYFFDSYPDWIKGYLGETRDENVNRIKEDVIRNFWHHLELKNEKAVGVTRALFTNLQSSFGCSLKVHVTLGREGSGEVINTIGQDEVEDGDSDERKKEKNMLNKSARAASEAAYVYVRGGADNCERRAINWQIEGYDNQYCGSSIGLALTVAIVSAYLDTPVPKNIAFTGEIVNKGEIYSVGGVRTKADAAYYERLSKVYIPYANRADISEDYKDFEIRTVTGIENAGEELFEYEDFRELVEKRRTKEKQAKQRKIIRWTGIGLTVLLLCAFFFEYVRYFHYDKKKPGNYGIGLADFDRQAGVSKEDAYNLFRSIREKVKEKSKEQPIELKELKPFLGLFNRISDQDPQKEDKAEAHRIRTNTDVVIYGYLYREHSGSLVFDPAFSFSKEAEPLLMGASIHVPQQEITGDESITSFDNSIQTNQSNRIITDNTDQLLNIKGILVDRADVVIEYFLAVKQIQNNSDKESIGNAIKALKTLCNSPDIKNTFDSEYLYLALASAYSRINNTIEARASVNEAIRLIKIKEKKSKGNLYYSNSLAYYISAEIYFNQGNYLEAINEYMESRKNLKQLVSMPGNKHNISLENRYASTFFYQGLSYLKMSKEETAIEYIEKANQEYEKILNQNPDNIWAYSNSGNTLLFLAVSYIKINEEKTAIKLLEKAVERYKKAIEMAPARTEFVTSLGNIYSQLGNCYLRTGNLVKAKEYFVKSIVELRQISGKRMAKADSSPDDLSVQQKCGQMLFWQAWNYQNLGIYNRAIQVYERSFKYYKRAIEISLENPEHFDRLGGAYYWTSHCYYKGSQNKDALKYIELSKNSFKECNKLSSENTLYISNYAGALLAEGNIYKDMAQQKAAAQKYMDAVAEYKKALSIEKTYKNYLKYAGGLLTAANYINLTDQNPDTGKLIEKAMFCLKHLIDKYPDKMVLFDYLGNSYLSLGDYYRKIRKFDDSLIQYELGAEYIGKALEKSPENAEYNHNIGTAIYKTARYYKDQQNYKKAVEKFKEAIPYYTKAVSSKPNAVYFKHIGNVFYNLGESQSKLASPEDVLLSFNKAKEYYGKAVEKDPDNLDYNNSLANTFFNIGNFYSAAGKYSSALQSYKEAIPYFDKITVNPDKSFYYKNAGNNYLKAGDCLRATDSPKEAVDYYMKAKKLYKSAIDREPDKLEYIKNHANAVYNIGISNQSLHNYNAAAEDFQNAAILYEDILRREPKKANNFFNLGNTYLNSGRYFKSMSMFDTAAYYFELSAKNYKLACKFEPENNAFIGNYAGAIFQKGNCYKEIGMLMLSTIEKRVVTSQGLIYSPTQFDKTVIKDGLNNFDKSIQSFKDAAEKYVFVLSKTSDNPDSYCDLANSYLSIAVSQNGKKKLLAYSNSINETNVSVESIEQSIQKAVNYYKAGLKINPNHQRSIYYLAYSMHKLGDMSSYTGSIKKAIPSYFDACKCYEKLYNTASYKRTDEFYDNYGRCLLSLALSYSNTGQHEKSIELSKKALLNFNSSKEVDDNQNIFTSQTLIGLSYTKIGEYEQSLKCYLHALDANPNILLGVLPNEGADKLLTNAIEPYVTIRAVFESRLMESYESEKPLSCYLIFYKPEKGLLIKKIVQDRNLAGSGKITTVNDLINYSNLLPEDGTRIFIKYIDLPFFVEVKKSI